MGQGAFSSSFGHSSLSSFHGSLHMGPGAYSAALQSAKRSLMSGPRSRYSGGGYHSSKPKSKRSKEEDFTEDIDTSKEKESSPNGKDKRKSKRDKFQPY